MADWSVAQEATKAAFSAGVASLTLGFGWLVGNRLSSFWSLRQKRRELDLSAANELHRLYGEFFAVWKLWNYLSRYGSGNADPGAPWVLVQRAALVEAGFEALLVRLASERVLDATSRNELGLLRQGFQHLRESITDGKQISWSYSEHPQYQAFKRLTCASSNLLSSDHSSRSPTASEAANALREITSNHHESAWEALDLNGGAA